jgi:hypothetical protein
MSLVRDQDRLRLLTATFLSVGDEDDRVIKFYERAAREGPDNFRLLCDTTAKKLKLAGKP